MKGLGDFNGQDLRGEFFDDDLTRRGPIPLTVRRAPVKTPLPIDVDFPIVASVDVDLGTPAPLPFPISSPTPHKPLGYHLSSSPSVSRANAAQAAASRGPSRGELVMNPSPRPPSSGRSYPSPSRSYPIQPTPTFTFAEQELWQSPSTTQRRARSGPGFFSIALLMLVAGAAGYLTVKYRAWQDVGPLVERATELARSLRTLAPSSSAEVPAPAATTPAAAPTGAPPSPTATPPEVAPAPQALRPEVVPIAPPNAPVAAPRSASASPERVHRYVSKRRHKALQPLSAEAAEEEALLAAPAHRR